MAYRTVRNWPPVWTWLGGGEKRQPVGEVGVLKELSYWPYVRNRCFLVIDFEGSSYMGCLLFDDEIFCHQIISILKGFIGLRIEQIGALEVGHTL